MKTLLSKGRKRSEIDIDGDKIILQELSLADSAGLKQHDTDDEAAITLRLIVASIIDADGKRVYSNTDIPALREALTLTTCKAIGEAIGRLNGFDGPKQSPKA